MAISDRIQAEARRTIDGMQRFYEKYSDDVDDAEELEHRIKRVEASMEGCNGLTQDEKIQKTAENLFELTCAQERSYDSMRLELRRSREEYKRDIDELRKQSSKDFEDLKAEIKSGIDGVIKKIEDSGCDGSAEAKRPAGGKDDKADQKFLSRIISEHPVMAFNAFIFLLVLVFVSGHFELLAKMTGFVK